MKIYVAHSRSFDFIKELYEPLSISEVAKHHELIFPHKESGEPFSSRDLFINGCDFVLAEVSFPATGLGIELGWADILKIPIVCIYKTGAKLSGSLKVVSKDFIEYNSIQDLLIKLEDKFVK